LFDFHVVTAADVFNFGAPVCTLRTFPAAAAARPCIAANEYVARKLRVDWTHCLMPMKPEEAAGLPFGLGAASLGTAATLFFFEAASHLRRFGTRFAPRSLRRHAPFEFEAAFGVLRGFSRELSSSLLEGSLTACATIKKWAWDINQ
jgi:hypothetical protein